MRGAARRRPASLRVRSSQTFNVMACRLDGHPLFVTKGCMHAQQEICWHMRQVSGRSKQQQAQTETTCAWAGSMLRQLLLPVITQLCNDTAATIKVD